MTAPAWLREMEDRCSDCGCHPTKQGHIAPCEPSGPLGVLLGRKLAARGMSATVAAHPDAAALVDAAIMRRVQAGVEFSANTIRAELTSLTPDERPVIGALMNSVARRHCNKVGEEPSSDPATHGKTVARWKAKAAA